MKIILILLAIFFIGCNQHDSSCGYFNDNDERIYSAFEVTVICKDTTETKYASRTKLYSSDRITKTEAMYKVLESHSDDRYKWIAIIEIKGVR